MRHLLVALWRKALEVHNTSQSENARLDKSELLRGLSNLRWKIEARSREEWAKANKAPDALSALVPTHKARLYDEFVDELAGIIARA